ncbi:hypothetical protein SEA_BADDON_57 [Gordonia phage Baddon]|nr:hypothetical protein SEA_BADDON_57 [Gordonia phage Baddon]
MTDQTNPRTPRDIAQLLTATIREGARGGDLAAVGAAATAAAILDLADAIRETRTDDEPDNTPTPPEKLLCLAEGHTPRGNRVVCAEPAGHPRHHIAGGYQWWDDGRPATSTLPAGYVAKMPDVVLHTSEGGDTEPVTSSDHLLHEHLLVNPPTERLGALVDSAARWARVTAGSGLSNVLTACVEAINDLHRQTVEQHYNTIVSGHTSGDEARR